MPPTPRHCIPRNRPTRSLNVIPRTPLRSYPLARADIVQLYVRSKFRTGNAPLMQKIADLENAEKRRRRASSGAVDVRSAAAMRKKVLQARFPGLKEVGRNAKRMMKKKRELSWPQDYGMRQDGERGLLDAFGGLSIGGWGGCEGEGGDGEQMMVMWIGTGRW